MPGGNVTCKFIKPDGNRCGAKPKEDGFCINVHHTAEKNVRVPGEVKSVPLGIAPTTATIESNTPTVPVPVAVPSSPAGPTSPPFGNVAPPPFAPAAPGPRSASSPVPVPAAPLQEVPFPSSQPNPEIPTTGSTNGSQTQQNTAGPTNLPPGFGNLAPVQPVQPVQKQKLPPQPPSPPQNNNQTVPFGSPVSQTTIPPFGGSSAPVSLGNALVQAGNAQDLRFPGGAYPGAPMSHRKKSQLSWLQDAELLQNMARLLCHAAQDPDHVNQPARTPDTFKNLAEEYADLQECAEGLCEALIRMTLFHMES